MKKKVTDKRDNEIEAIGIDLGTSQSAVSCFYTDGNLETIPIIQFLGESKIHEHMTLPSFLYYPRENELDGVTLPWHKEKDKTSKTFVAGLWSRKRSTELPSRGIASAKSWLCCSHIPRKDAILPWQSDIGEKVSPFFAIQLYLEHIKESTLWQFKKRDVFLDFSKTDVIITVPASFDEVARQLISEAAKNVGFIKLSLLEEPQAAFYSWTRDHEKDWRKQVSKGSWFLFVMLVVVLVILVLFMLVKKIIN